MAGNDEMTGTADVQVEISPIAHIIAPLAAIGATLLVRKVMDSGYERVTGGSVPRPRDPRVTFGRALMWAAITAATAAVVEVAVYRLANHWGERTVTPPV